MKRTALVLLLLLAGGAAALEWVQLHPEGDPPVARSNAAAVYDPAGHRVVLFGGLRAGGDLNDVWELGLAPLAWRKITPDSGPAPDTRWSHNAVYDPAGRRMLVWSGRHLGDFFNDVWAFDLDGNTWSRFSPETRPASRYGTAAVFDLRRGRLVSFAGFTDLGRFDDTWAFDPAASVWTEISTDPRPLARCLHTAAYDPVGYRMLMFGGQGGGNALNDLWSLDLDTGAWSDITPESGPGGRTFAASVYDPGSHQFVIFGGAGIGGLGERSPDTWAFDLAAGTWSLLQPEGAAPEPRSGAAAVYIEGENRALFIGGAKEVGLLNEVWALERLDPTAVVDRSWGRVKQGLLTGNPAATGAATEPERVGGR